MSENPVFDRLVQRIRELDSAVCVGLDPHVDRLPAAFRRQDPIDAWRRFLFGAIEAVAGVVPAVKPQIAFFEQMGPEGYSLYFEVVRESRRRGLFVIGDAKRGDIGSTAQAYAEAHLGRPDSVDALTVNPYLGSDGIQPFLDVARRGQRGLFALLRTSNPSSGEIQKHGGEAHPLVHQVARLIEAWGRGGRGAEGFHDVGAVVGATHPEEAADLRSRLPSTFFLVPGFGAQGGGPEDVRPTFLPNGLGALISSSRGVLFPGGVDDPEPLASIRAAAETMTAQLRGLRDRGA